MRVDTGAIYCGACGSREFAPTRRRTTNVVRDTERVHARLEEQAHLHAEDCGVEVAAVLECEDLHRLGGVDLIGKEDDSLVQRSHGSPLVCHYRLWVLGDAPDPRWAEARADLLLPHWHRGCWIMHKAVEAVPTHHTGDGRVVCRAEGCGHADDGRSAEYAILLGWHHAAREHPVGEVTMDVAACLACDTFDVVLSPVADGLPSVVGPPESCACEEPAYWGRRLL